MRRAEFWSDRAEIFWEGSPKGCPVILTISASYLFYFFRSRSRRKVTFFLGKKKFPTLNTSKIQKNSYTPYISGEFKAIDENQRFSGKIEFFDPFRAEKRVFRPKKCRKAIFPDLRRLSPVIFFSFFPQKVVRYTFYMILSRFEQKKIDFSKFFYVPDPIPSTLAPSGSHTVRSIDISF